MIDKRLKQRIYVDTQYSSFVQCVSPSTVEVFHDLTGISQEWTGLKSLIKVERIGTRAGKAYHQVAYYISSVVKSAADFAKGIRGHWGIENRLPQR